MVNVFSIILVAISFGIIIQMLRVYPSKLTPKYVYVFVFIGWWLPFLTIALVPYDVYVTLSGDGSTEFLYVCWEILYWVIFSFCWVILPLMKNFMTAGEFTILTKLRAAFISRIKYLIAMVVLLVVFIVYLAIIEDLDKKSIQAFLIAMGNVWGLLLIIILIGYGVVAIPRIWWYKGDYQKSLNYLRLKAVQVDEKRIEARYELDQCILKAIAFEKDTRLDQKLHLLAERIINRCPEEELEMNKTRTYNLPPAEDANLKNLVILNTKLKNIKSEIVRLECRWNQLLDQVFVLEDIIANKENSGKYIRSAFWKEKTGRAARFREVMEWWWHTRAMPIVSKLLSVLFACFSILVLLGETTLFVNTSVSVFPLFFKSQHGDAGTQILCFIPMTYLFSTAYIGLFTLRIDGSYGLYNNNHTDPANLVWSAFFTSRLVHPLIYNFLLFIKVSDTQFHKVMGLMTIVPFLGSDFCKYFPLLIVVFAILNVLDFYTWLMVKIGVPQLSFSEHFDVGKLEEGKSLLKKARGDKEKGYTPKVVYNTDAPVRSISLSKPGTSRYDLIKQRGNPNLASPLNKP